MKYKSLDHIEDEIFYNQKLIDNYHSGAWYTLEEATQALHNAKEAKRVFSYHAKQAITPKGTVVRH